jgi:energy-coupling factor transporter ATP-binding protein EcfA2
MKLVSATVGPYKSIVTPQEVSLDERVTVMVGQNEAGKSAILEAIYKTRPVPPGDAEFKVLLDFPRKNLNRYEREHPDFDTTVVRLTYRLTDAEHKVIENVVGTAIPAPFEFTVDYRYDNKHRIAFNIDEGKTLSAEIAKQPLDVALKTAVEKARSYPEAIKILESHDLDAEGASLLSDLEQRVKTAGDWLVPSFEGYKAIEKFIPRFLYFDEYNILPGKTNLRQLKQRRDSNKLSVSDRSVMALLSLAAVDLDELLREKSHEETVARLQGSSIDVSDRVFEFWKQNEFLEVEFSIDEDTTDDPPFDNGPNLYIAIKNQRHRVSVPFDQRSKGFIWFFSFIVWFDDAQAQAESSAPLILLLDEPGLNLHALAQADFLRYIKHLGDVHQVVYTTHSPFLVESDALDRVRVVEDRDNSGTTVSDRLDSKDPKSIFPLQAALGYTIAQNLFISERNLLIEGPADLIYLQNASAILEKPGRASLDPRIVLVPVGGLDKVATFIALLAGNQLKFAVCVDKATIPDQRLKEMVMQKIVSDKALMDFGMFRQPKAGPTDATDVEDLFEVPHYLAIFNAAYAGDLKGVAIAESDLPTGTRIVERINKALVSKGINVRPSGGFNHFLVASRAVAAGLTLLPSEELAFEELFKAANALLT